MKKTKVPSHFNMRTEKPEKGLLCQIILLTGEKKYGHYTGDGFKLKDYIPNPTYMELLAYWNGFAKEPVEKDMTECPMVPEKEVAAWKNVF